MKTFNLVRTQDVSGISGVGVVGEGCVFHDGKVVLHWFGSVHSIEIHDSLEDLLTIHGHGGLTTVEWDDPEQLCTCDGGPQGEGLVSVPHAKDCPAEIYYKQNGYY